ncbi:porphobilinogen synthase [Marinilabiliaceae bacterium ANBcel2]|nr:porphobilinogen synthase [Marinilabiliaceae bacterium ANBcel2]
MTFPVTRLRRLRKNSTIRNMVRETEVTGDDLIMPYFVCTGRNIKKGVASMPGIYHYSIDLLIKEVNKMIKDTGINKILLFGIPDEKDDEGLVACDFEAVVPNAIRKLKEAIPHILIIADVCNCEYTTHGHCGTIVDEDVDNDLTVNTLVAQSLILAEAGADILAPSDMMDGRVDAIRKGLDNGGFQQVPIMSYSVKYASAFYGPFREAAQSTPQFGDRSTYQMNFSNRKEAMREIAEDIKEGADIVMVKPALSYLDIVRECANFTNIPVAAYNVSGEYSMVKAAAEMGWVDETKIVEEILTSIKRAGADIIISYHAIDFVLSMKKQQRRV